MRTTLFSAAVVAALAVTGWTPNDARAQVVIFPVITTRSSNSLLFTYDVSPTYSYGYTYTFPMNPVYLTPPVPSSNSTTPLPMGTGPWYPTSPLYTPAQKAWIGSRYWGVGYGPYKRW
jgi:hypothetical protein